MEINTLALIGCGVGTLALFIIGWVLMRSETRPYKLKIPKHLEETKDVTDIE